MRFIDCHCHMNNTMVSADDLLRRLDEAEVEAVGVMSFAPEHQVWVRRPGLPTTPEDKLRVLTEFGRHSDRIYTMYWIDPLDADALEQVDRAAEAGVTGFKVICDRFYPYEDRPMEVFARIAEVGKPLQLHSGILYSPHAASRYNRPVWFESLIDIPRLRFALAHASWPWVEECLAVYGYWQARRQDGLTTAEMFLDTTPGTPVSRREEMLSMLFRIGYDVRDNVMLGIDNTWDYNVEYSRKIRRGDELLLDSLHVAPQVQEGYFWKNYLRFIGKGR